MRARFTCPLCHNEAELAIVEDEGTPLDGFVVEHAMHVQLLAYEGYSVRAECPLSLKRLRFDRVR